MDLAVGLSWSVGLRRTAGISLMSSICVFLPSLLLVFACGLAAVSLLTLGLLLLIVGFTSSLLARRWLLSG